MSQLWIRLLPAVTVLFLGGCFFGSPRQIDYYDLNSPEPQTVPGLTVTFNEFDNFSGCTQKMRYRLENHRIVIDDFNKWAQSPENLLNRYLNSALASSTRNAPRIIVGGSLEVFEIDLERRLVFLQFAYVLQPAKALPDEPKPERQVFRSRVKFEDSSPSAFAAAFSQAMVDLTAKIRQDLAAYPKKAQ